MPISRALDVVFAVLRVLDVNLPMKNPKTRFGLLATFGFLCVLSAVWMVKTDRFPRDAPIVQRLRGQATVADRLSQFEAVAQTRWQPYFARKGVSYPPRKLLFVALKQEKQLQIYAANSKKPLTFIRSIPVQALSGKLGPKLRYGDFQVPEGFYRIESLNSNSAFHLALRINYPNEFDRAQAEKDGRTELGGDIMIHGSNVSIGCLAMGDEATEDLFVLAAKVGIENIEVLLSPLDFRTRKLPDDATRPAWTRKLLAEIEAALVKLPTR